MTPLVEKRTVDMQIIGEWVTPGSRVLDLGCGRGALLDYLVQTKEVAALGVDLDFARVTAGVILEALRVGRALTVGFVNHGFWKNRVDGLLRGRKVRNAVYTTEWFESRPANPVTIADFEHFCAAKGITLTRRVHLRGDWRTPCRVWPNLFAGYALYDLAR